MPEMIHKLCSLGSPPIVATLELPAAEKELTLSGSHKSELLDMLKIKNGFYAFESALHVFPFVMENWFENQDLVRWNLPSTWKQLYGEETVSLFAFAEDIFGYQFGSYKGRIVRFDPETGMWKTSARPLKSGPRSSAKTSMSKQAIQSHTSGKPPKGVFGPEIVWYRSTPSFRAKAPMS